MVGGFVRNSLNSLNIVRPALIEHHHQLCAVYINRTAPTHLVLCSRPQHDTVTRPRSLQKRVVRFHCIAMRLEVLASCESRERRIRQISKSGYLQQPCPTMDVILQDVSGVRDFLAIAK